MTFQMKNYKSGIWSQ
uniref:Uncharacterized protein n=1 Tax=Rhizophora mucronata TaxID=61149 RepID=A0A2P2R3Z8_RHIMU